MEEQIKTTQQNTQTPEQQELLLGMIETAEVGFVMYDGWVERPKTREWQGIDGINKAK